MDQNTIELILSAKDDRLRNTLNRSERQIKGFGDKSIATFRRMGQSIQGFSDRWVSGLAAIGVGFGLVQMTRDMIAFDGTLRQVRRSAGLSGPELQALRKNILDLIDPAAKLKVPLTKGEWADMAKALSDTGIGLKVIRDILPDVGKGTVASHTAPAVYAETIGEFLDKYKVMTKDLPALQEQINAAMKFPDVRKDPEAFLRVLQGLAKPMQIIGAEGMRNVTPLLALTSQLTAISGSAADAGTSVESLLNGIFRLAKQPEKLKVLRAHGVDFFDKEGMKSIEELLPEFKKLAAVVEAHGGNFEAAAMAIFGRPEAGKALMVIVKYYDEIIAKERALRKETGGLGKDFVTEAAAMENKLKTFQNQLDTFKLTHMTTALSALSRVLDQLNSHPFISKFILRAGVGMGGMLIIGKIVGMVGSVARFSKDIERIWKKGGKIGEVMTQGIPVYVTNWGGGIPGVAASGGAGAVARALGLAGIGAAGAAGGIGLAYLATLYGAAEGSKYAGRRFIQGNTPASFTDAEGRVHYDVRGFGGGPKAHVDITLTDQRTFVSSHNVDGAVKVNSLPRGRFDMARGH